MTLHGRAGSSPAPGTFFFARVAQLVEHDLAKVGVAGSNPVSRSYGEFHISGTLFCFVEQVIFVWELIIGNVTDQFIIRVGYCQLSLWKFRVSGFGLMETVTETGNGFLKQQLVSFKE